jgi:hypothetical protein
MSFFLVPQAWEKPNQHTTPINTTGIIEETVTVVDPRHPLYPQTFRLIGITTKQYLGRCCVVLDQASRERIVPVSVTDRSPDPQTIAPIPLDLASLQDLVLVFTHIHSHRAKGATNEEDRTYSTRTDATCPITEAIQDSHCAATGDTDTSRASLDLPVRPPAAGSVGNFGQHLSHGRRSDQRAAQEGGR